MITSGFSAEYGRFAGGVLSVATKSGANRVRGSLYEFLRNSALNARNYFDAGKSKVHSKSVRRDGLRSGFHPEAVQRA